MSGPITERLGEGGPVLAGSLAGWKWPLNVAIVDALEPGIIVTCARGMCDAPLVELSFREVKDGWRFDPAYLAELAHDHLVECHG
jgi:hypothetical protein